MMGKGLRTDRSWYYSVFLNLFVILLVERCEHTVAAIARNKGARRLTSEGHIR